MVNLLIIYLILSPTILGGIGYIISKKQPKIREVFFIGVTTLEIIAMLVLMLVNDESILCFPLVGTNLSFKVDGFRAIYSMVSIFLWLMTITFSKDYMAHYSHKDRYYLFYLITLSGVVGVFMSNDLLTTFTFFEIMSIASYPLVIHDEKEESINAGRIYLAIAIITGMILLMGLFILFGEIDSLAFSDIRSYVLANGVSNKLYISGLLMLVGFGAKAGMYPLHVWLPKAHPVAPSPASALLSGILTKTGVFGIVVISANLFFEETSFAYILLVLAIITMFLGALLALFSINLKRTLACSSMSQIGFILVGISFYLLLKEEGSIAILGSFLHMINHSIIKLVLFMCSGVVLMNLHELDLNKIQGFGRKKYFFMIVFAIGSLGIMGVPFFNGYVSKTMIHESIVEYINLNDLTNGILVLFKTIEWTFLISGGMTVAYMTKLFVTLFVSKNKNEELQKQYDNQKNYLPLLSKVVFIISVIAIPIIGILPNIVGVRVVSNGIDFFFVDKLSHNIEFFGWECLKGGIISLIIGITIYLIGIKFGISKNAIHKNLWPSKIDIVTLIYKPILNGILYITLKIFYVVSLSFDILINYLLLISLDVLYAISISFDGLIYLAKITILKPFAFTFNPKSLSYRVGEMIDKIKHTDKYAKDFEHKEIMYANGFLKTTSSFSFALGMSCLGLVLVILFVFGIL